MSAALYAALPPGERSIWHGRAARLLARERVDPERVALHLLRTEPADDEEAVALLRAAAASASARGAPETAASTSGEHSTIRGRPCDRGPRPARARPRADRTVAARQHRLPARGRRAERRSGPARRGCATGVPKRGAREHDRGGGRDRRGRPRRHGGNAAGDDRAPRSGGDGRPDRARDGVAGPETAAGPARATVDAGALAYRRRGAGDVRRRAGRRRARRDRAGACDPCARGGAGLGPEHRRRCWARDERCARDGRLFLRRGDRRGAAARVGHDDRARELHPGTRALPPGRAPRGRGGRARSRTTSRSRR